MKACKYLPLVLDRDESSPEESDAADLKNEIGRTTAP